MTNFIFVEDDEGRLSLYNLDQIKLITEIHDGHCRLTFDRDLTVELHGDGADQLVANLAARSESVNGTPMAEILERFKRSEKVAPSKVIPFDGSEPQS